MWLQINCMKRNFVNLYSSQYVIRLIEDEMRGTSTTCTKFL